MSDYKMIKDHWDSLSINKDSYKSSWEDFYMIQKEINEISQYIHGDEDICDIGCNNGYFDLKLLSAFKGINIVGIDYSDGLISQAKISVEESEYSNRAKFIVGNILDPNSFPDKKFDIILIKRVLINLTNEEDQIKALSNVKEMLNTNGRIILSEAVEENFDRLNKLRKEFGLGELNQPWHNKYLSETLIHHIYSQFNVELDNDYSSSYYVFSRVFHPWIKSNNNNNNLDYMSEINRMGSMFPNFGDYGVQRLFILSLIK